MSWTHVNIRVMWYVVDTCKSVHDSSTEFGGGYVDLSDMNEQSSVESCIRYFHSRKMRWLRYASGMRETVCVQNFGGKTSWLHLIKKDVYFGVRDMGFPLTKMGLNSFCHMLCFVAFPVSDICHGRMALTLEVVLSNSAVLWL
jgi:hypothetical protein